jgi:protein-tyrosine-phosphatase
MHIHFICTGNAYRSRLAESYLKSKKLKGIRVSSSGIHASRKKNGPICWYALRLLSKDYLIPYVKRSWHETTDLHIQKADYIIFMDEIHHNHVQKFMKLDGKRYEIWNIPDLDSIGITTYQHVFEKEQEMFKHTEETYKTIKAKVDTLIESLHI